MLIFRIITRNFTRIIDVMQQFRAGDLTARVQVSSQGEEKQLGDMFNEMADILTENLEKLKEVEHLRRDLIANVSHDLRTPIAIIRGYVETLQMKEKTLSSDDRQRYMNIVQESTEKLEKLVNELFELSKFEANQVQPVMEPFSISELVSDSFVGYQLLAQKKKLHIKLDLMHSLPPVIGDVSLIERVLQNLIDNALKYTPEGGEILIRTFHPDAGHVEVAISDTGIGIPENEREQIFARYFKANNFTDLKNSTGLGLAIVKKILDLHNSSLELTSKVEEGSTFAFQLPVFNP
jgi:signal transduction histidine kinase